MRPLSTLGRRIGDVLSIAILLVIGFAVYAGILVAVVIGGPVLLIVNQLQKRRFLRRHAGQRFLVVRRRHGWGDFVINNVEPVLPSKTKCVWEDSKEPFATAPLFTRWRLKRPGGVRRPYLIVFGEQPVKLRIIPMHEKLLPLKAHARSSDEIREAVRAIVSDSLR